MCELRIGLWGKLMCETETVLVQRVDVFTEVLVLCRVVFPPHTHDSSRCYIMLHDMHAQCKCHWSQSQIGTPEGVHSACSVQSVRSHLPSHCGCLGIITLQGLSLCQFHHFTFWRRGLMRRVEVTLQPSRPTVWPHQSKRCHLILSGRTHARIPSWRRLPGRAAPLTLTVQRKLKRWRFNY